jgi:uncharacterized membrane protein
MSMDVTPPPPPPEPFVSNRQLALVVYILYFASYFVGITALVGVIIAYVEVGRADPLLRSHYQFQIRTFWIGLLYLVVGIILCIVVVGIFVLLWWFIWTLVRCIKGVIALNEGKPVEHPTSWLFG